MEIALRENLTAHWQNITDKTNRKTNKMKRSKINQIIEHADTMIHEFGFTLQPFAYWSPDEFRAILITKD